MLPSILLASVLAGTECAEPPTIWSKALAPERAARCVKLGQLARTISVAPDDALRGAEEVLRAGSTSKAALVVAGLAAFRLQKWEVANKHFENAVQGGTRLDPEPLLARARSLFAVGSPAAAGAYRDVLARASTLTGDRDLAGQFFEATCAELLAADLASDASHRTEHEEMAVTLIQQALSIPSVDLVRELRAVERWQAARLGHPANARLDGRASYRSSLFPWIPRAVGAALTLHSLPPHEANRSGAALLSELEQLLPPGAPTVVAAHRSLQSKRPSRR